MNKNTSECACSAAPALIFPCSGSADVGEISDRIARKLTREGVGKMFCLAGVGAGLSGFVGSAQAARINITIDGCTTACSRKVLENIGIKPFSFVLTDMGLVKGKAHVDEQSINKLSEEIKKTITERDKDAQKEKSPSATGGCCPS